MKRFKVSLRHAQRPLAWSVATLLAASYSIDAEAAKYSFLNEELTLSFDSTLSYGVAWRDGDAHRLLNVPNNGGNPKFESGDVVTNRVTGIHELELGYKNFGAFVRGTYFYDFANNNENLTIPTISDGVWARKEAVSEGDLLDAYVRGRFGPVELRLGRQVISWGESTFIQGSLNTINTFDVSKLRAPGSELKQAFLPNESAYVQVALNPNLSVEGFVLTSFDKIKLDPAGTYWNTNAAIAPGGFRLGPLLRAPDNEASDGGQWGVAFRYATSLLGLDFETGLYFMNRHSDLPYLSVIRGAPFGAPATPTANYFLDYPEDVKVWGASFNTLIGPFAVSGEWSHRDDAPIQLNGFVEAAIGAPSQLTPTGPVATGTIVRGYDRVKVDQIQVTAQLTKVPTYWNMIPLIPNAENSNFLIEAAYGLVSDRPNAVTFTPVTSNYSGLQAVFSLDYNRAIADVINLRPTVAFRYDMDGVSSEISPNFLEGRRALTLALNWDYLINWTGSLSYTGNFGGEDVLNASRGPVFGDRDRRWYSINVAYQF